MSNHLTSVAYKRDLGTHTRKAIIVLLADKASDDGSGIWASKQRMADELCMSKQTVLNTLKAFLREGLIWETGSKKCTNGYTVEYTIDTDKLEALPLVKWHSDQSKGLTGQPARPVNGVDPTSQTGGPDQSTSLTRTPINPNEPPKGKADADSFGPSDVLESYNEIAAVCGLPLAERMTAKRMKAYRARKREYPEAKSWRAAFKTLRTSVWMHGNNDRDWRADLDFFLQAKSFTKLVEGSYGKAH